MILNSPKDFFGTGKILEKKEQEEKETGFMAPWDKNFFTFLKQISVEEEDMTLGTKPFWDGLEINWSL